jgi:valyl-tRNA synthetase
VAQAIESYRFDDAAAQLYQFVWGTFCDWYLEFAKPILSGEGAAETRATTAWVIRRILRALHPVMPFVTEELAKQFKLPDEGMLIRAPWSTIPTLIDGAAAPR